MDAIVRFLGYGLTDRMTIALVAIYVLVFELDAEARIDLAWPIAVVAAAALVAFSIRPSSLRKVVDGIKISRKKEA